MVDWLDMPLEPDMLEQAESSATMAAVVISLNMKVSLSAACNPAVVD